MFCGTKGVQTFRARGPRESKHSVQAPREYMDRGSNYSRALGPPVQKEGGVQLPSNTGSRIEFFCTRDLEVKYPDVYRCNPTHTDSAHSYNSYRYYIEIEVFFCGLSTDYLAIIIQSRIKKADVGRGKKDKSKVIANFSLQVMN